MNTTMTVQVPTDTLLKLIEKLRRCGGSQDISEAMTLAVGRWLADPAAFAPGADPAGLHGYQWKSLFLPEGTVLKSWSYGENNYACVEGDQIIHNGRAVSPNQFAQSFARSTRSAWHDLYVRRPGDKTFKLANRLRAELAAAEKSAAAETQRPAPIKDAAAQGDVPPVLVPPVAAVPRNTDREPGWDLPERRKFRYRLEDVAY
ncbi:hypothetical protein [Duganella violaceipulchra]|uniref:Uncharacterized protein n=2 Tax=Duganella violaceipulchra TaxID=2849652 RepID=A0ABT1GMK0_9BURK|nr:hypothetical protein [Duganella violaceicalia]MCP2010203.1 hypothetical protein [Duganella violaceicalia]